jgi:hypothetical protein
VSPDRSFGRPRRRQVAIGPAIGPEPGVHLGSVYVSTLDISAIATTLNSVDGNKASGAPGPA